MPISPDYRSKLEFDNYNDEPIYTSPGAGVEKPSNDTPVTERAPQNRFRGYLRGVQQDIIKNPRIKQNIKEEIINNQREAGDVVDRNISNPSNNTSGENSNAIIPNNQVRGIGDLTRRGIQRIRGGDISSIEQSDLDKINIGVAQLLNKEVITIPRPKNMLGKLANQIEGDLAELSEEQQKIIQEQILNTITGVIENAKKKTREVGNELQERIKTFKEAASREIKTHLGVAISGLTIALLIAGSSYIQSSAREIPINQTNKKTEQLRVAPQETPFASNVEPTPTPVPQTSAEKSYEKKAILVKSSDTNPINEPVYLSPEQSKSLTGGETIGMILAQNLNGNGVYIVENKNKSGISLSEIETKIGEKFTMVVTLKPESESGREEHLDLSQFISKNEEGNFILDPSLLPQETLKLISERSSNDGLSYGFVDDTNYYRCGSTRDLEDFQQVTKIETGAF